MADYTFTTLTAAQALALSGSDTLLIDVGTGSETSVSYGVPAADQITLVARHFGVTAMQIVLLNFTAANLQAVDFIL